MNLNEVSSIHSVAKKHLDNLKKEKSHNEQRQPTYDIAEDIQKTKETELDIHFKDSIEDRQGTDKKFIEK
jgi:hypothetical protein